MDKFPLRFHLPTLITNKGINIAPIVGAFAEVTEAGNWPDTLPPSFAVLSRCKKMLRFYKEQFEATEQFYKDNPGCGESFVPLAAFDVVIAPKGLHPQSVMCMPWYEPLLITQTNQEST